MENFNIDGRSPSDLFERFIEATTMKNVITIHKKILEFADLKPCDFNNFFPRYKRAVTSDRQKKNWKAKALFSKIEKRANHRCYSNTRAPTALKAVDNQIENCMDDSLSSHPSVGRSITNNNALANYNCLIIGSGPAGLRTAIEMQLLGSDRVVVVEKRGRFSRNNVLHLWPFVIDDLKSLGAKKFYGKFCAGSIDHISIRQLQLILLKVCLMTGCDFRESCSYINLCPLSIDPKYIQSAFDDGAQEISDNTGCIYKPEGNDAFTANLNSDNTLSFSNESKCDSNNKQITELRSVKTQAQQRHIKSLQGACVHFESDRKEQEKELHSIKWDIIIGADGRRNTLKNLFPRKEFRGRLAIAITANFINRQTTAETSVPEISGLSFIYNQDMFNALAHDTNIELENICYYKDDTHYFVMTAKKRSLLERGVLVNDFATTQDLLSEKNINKEALLKYAKDAAYWTTGLEPLDFALNHYGQEDCAMFDFTSMYAASNACKALRTKQGGLTLMSLVGDSLLEPFWPTGSGCARGFLSSLDAAWMCRQWAVNRCPVLDYHGNVASRSSRNSNGGQKYHPELATYDKMALSVIAERESIYRILAQTTSENLQQNYSLWTLNPHTRYPNLNRHLIIPSQVEHLIADDSKLSTISDENRCVKSINKSRRSPRRLKPAFISPTTQLRNSKNKSRTPRSNNRSKSRQDISFDELNLKLEESYKYLADGERGGLTQYLSYKCRESGSSDDLFVPSLSGTLPSSHNLSRLEARKARDIDECLRHRRQKTKITYVRDQLISQMRGESQKGDKESGGLFAGGNAVIFNEIKRLREQQSRGVRANDNMRDVSGPLSLLNSMRRCASFAERVKSFESKFANVNQASPESNVNTPKIPIDNVRNLPQFATLQELFINNAPKAEEKPKKSHIPIAKLTKDDWNVKCWENRLVDHKLRQMSSSTRSLNKSISVDTAQVNRASKLGKQADIFQDRINEMANKLKTPNQRQGAQCTNPRDKTSTRSFENNSVRAQGWVSHLKRELAKGAEFNRKSVNNQPMNPVLPNKPIKKLFEDDDDIAMNKHYDHLCVNRPINKYLSKGAYTSHLARTNVKSTIINRPIISAEAKQAYLGPLTSRGSSASSNLSDYSTNTGNSSSGSGSKQGPTRSSLIDVECFRCRKFVSSSDRIIIESSSLHRSCLTCADCKITLRSNEIHYYMGLARKVRAKSTQSSTSDEPRFSCVICCPEIRSALTREVHDHLKETVKDSEYSEDAGQADQQQHFSSREAFLNSSINYNELYKNLIQNDPSDNKTSSRQEDEVIHDNGKSNLKNSEPAIGASINRNHSVTMSPVQVTIPMKLISNESSGPNLKNSERTDEYDHIEQEIINYSEATLILPPDSARVTPSPSNLLAESHDHKPKLTGSETTKKLTMIDEEELQRILHLDGKNAGHDLSGGSGSSSSDSKTNDFTTNTDSSDENSCKSDAQPDKSCPQDGIPTESRVRNLDGAKNSGCESSSLDLPSDTDEYDRTDDDTDMDSTCDDFVTTEELDNQYFDANMEAPGRQTSTSDTQESVARQTPPSAGLAAS